MDGWGQPQPSATTAAPRQTASRWSTEPDAQLPPSAIPAFSQPKALSAATDGWTSSAVGGMNAGGAEVSAWIGEASEADPPSATSPSPIDAERERGAERVMAREEGRVDSAESHEGWGDEGHAASVQQVQVGSNHDGWTPPPQHATTYHIQSPSPPQFNEAQRAHLGLKPLDDRQNQPPPPPSQVGRRAPLPPQHVAFAQSGQTTMGPRTYGAQPQRFGGNSQGYGGQGGGMPTYTQGGRGGFMPPPQHQQQQHQQQQQQQHYQQQQYSQMQYQQQQQQYAPQYFQQPPSSNYQQPPPPPPMDAVDSSRSHFVLTASTPAFSPPVFTPPTYPPTDFSTIRLTPYAPPFQLQEPAPSPVLSTPTPVVDAEGWGDVIQEPTPAVVSNWSDWGDGMAPVPQVSVVLPPTQAPVVHPSPSRSQASPELFRRALPSLTAAPVASTTPVIPPPQPTPPSSIHSSQASTAVPSVASVVPAAPRTAMPDRNRGHTGGNARAKMTEEQLNEKLAAMRISNQKTAVKAAAAEADKGAFEQVQAQEKELRARQKVEREEARIAEGQAQEAAREAEAQAAVDKIARATALQKSINAERERNAAIKLRKVGGRQWDNDKVSQEDGKRNSPSLAAAQKGTTADRTQENAGVTERSRQGRGGRGGKENRGEERPPRVNGGGGGWGLPDASSATAPPTPSAASNQKAVVADATTSDWGSSEPTPSVAVAASTDDTWTSWGTSAPKPVAVREDRKAQATTQETSVADATTSDWGSSEPTPTPAAASTDDAWTSWGTEAPKPAALREDRKVAEGKADRGGGRGGDSRGSSRGERSMPVRGATNGARGLPPHLDRSSSRTLSSSTTTTPPNTVSADSTPSSWGSDEPTSTPAVVADDAWSSWSADTPATSTKGVQGNGQASQRGQGRGGRGGASNGRGTQENGRARGGSNGAGRALPPHLEATSSRTSPPTSAPKAVSADLSPKDSGSTPSPPSTAAAAVDPWAEWTTDTPTTRWSDEPVAEASKGESQSSGW